MTRFKAPGGGTGALNRKKKDGSIGEGGRMVLAWPSFTLSCASCADAGEQRQIAEALRPSHSRDGHHGWEGVVLTRNVRHVCCL